MKLNLFLKETLDMLQKLSVLKGMIPEYPYDAVREAIINAIAHRDYEIKGTDVTFFLFMMIELKLLVRGI